MHLKKAVLIALAAATTAQAEDTADKKYGAEFGVSSLGLFAAPTFAVADNVNIRTPLYFARLNTDRNFEGNDTTFDLSVTSIALLADYYVAGSSFRLSGGIAVNGYEMSSTVTDPTLNDNAYTGEFGLDLAQEQNVAPVVALGFNKSIRDKWGFVTELGIRVANMKLDATAPASISDPDRARLATDVAAINDDLASVGVIPFLSIGASVNF